MLDLTKTYRTQDGKHTGIRLRVNELVKDCPSSDAALVLANPSAGPIPIPSSWTLNGEYLIGKPGHEWSLVAEEELPPPFRYEDCPIIDSKRMAETMDGRKVVLLCNNAPGYRPIRGYYATNGMSIARNSDGTLSDVDPSEALRVPPKPKRVVWVNLFHRYGDGHFTAAVWNSQEDADGSINAPDRIDGQAYPIEIKG